MKISTSRGEIVDEMSLKDLCRFCGSDESWVIELVDLGVLDPRGSTAGTWRFRGLSLSRAKKAQRLSRDLGINAQGVAVVLDLLEQRDSIRRRLSKYESI